MILTKKSLGFIFIIIASIFWSASAIIVKSLIANNFEPILIVQMRVTFSAIFIFIYFYFTDREKLKIKKNDILKFLFVAIFGLAGSNYFYYNAFKYISASLAILVQYTAPIFVFIYALKFHNEKITNLKTTALILSIAGIFLAVEAFKPEVLKLNFVGVLSALIAAVSYAIYNIGSKKNLEKYYIKTVLFYNIFFASLFWFIINNPIKIFEQNYSSYQWSILILISIISVLIPYSFYTIGLNYISSTEAVITSTMEPVFTIFFEFIFLGTLLGFMQIFGGVLVIVSIILLQIKNEN